MTGNENYVSISTGIGLKFLIGALAGIALGIFCLFAPRKVACLPFCYVLTLGIAILAYAVSETVGGSGALSVLLFGLMLGNETEILESLRHRRAWCTAVDDGLKRFESEIAFFVRTFFFVFLGIIATISSAAFVALGIILTVLLLVARVAAVYLSTIHSELKDERLIMTLVLTRGLAAAVLATLPAQYGLQYAPYFVNFAVVIILSTAVIATVGAIGYARRSNRKKASRYRI